MKEATMYRQWTCEQAKESLRHCSAAMAYAFLWGVQLHRRGGREGQ